MLSTNPALAPPSPQPDEFCPPPPSTLPTRARAVRAPPNRVVVADGYSSPRQLLEKRPVTPGSPLRPDQQRNRQRQEQPEPLPARELEQEQPPQRPTPLQPPSQAQSQSRQQEPQKKHGFNPPRPSLSPLSEYHSGFADEDLGPRSPSPSPFNLNHRRQQSFPNLLPLSFRSRTPSPTRKTHARAPSESQMPFTGDNRGNGRAESPRGGGLAGWFGGTTASAASSSTSAQQDDAITPDTTPTRPRGAPTLASGTSGPNTPKNTMTSRFMSAFSRFTPTNTTPVASNAPDNDDELFHLNIEAALFPSAPNSPSDPSRDAFSPAAFKNLHMNALGLLTKMQTAYRERTVALREAQAERSAQRDELEEAETRAQHLKMQLEDMARKAQEHELAMKALMEELAAEKRMRSQDRERMERVSMMSEDLGVDEDRRRRSHRENEDTDGESEESESVFSRCRSPMLPMTPAWAGPGLASGEGLSKQRGQPQPQQHQQQQPPQPQQMNTFQKIIKGISGDIERAAEVECSNCKGQDSRMAWDTVSLLRDENRHLKTRVSELEAAVDGALDAANGIGF